MKHRARRPPRSPAILAARGSARERLLPFCAAGDRTYAFPTPLDRGMPVVPLMGAPARLTGPCRPAWDGKLELCGVRDAGWARRTVGGGLTRTHDDAGPPLRFAPAFIYKKNTTFGSSKGRACSTPPYLSSRVVIDE